MGSAGNNTQQQQQLHIFFLPHLARGHMIPLLDTARLLAKLGARCTYVTTTGNSSIVSGIVDANATAGLDMQLLLIPFPDVGLPPGCENTATIPAGTDAIMKLYRANCLLQQPFEQLLREHNPDAIVADYALLWPAHVAESFGIPHVQFNVTGPFSTILTDAVHLAAHLDDDPLTVTIAPLTGLPQFVLRRSELPMQFRSGRSTFMDMQDESGRKSYGVIYNTFRELEGDWLANIMAKKRVWCVGPLQLGSISNTAGDLTKNWEGIKKWLDSKEPESVVYVSFGTECHFSHEQLRELAIGLESSGHSFVWVVRGEKDTTMKEWLPERFEEKVGGRGLVITEWAPQFFILNHPALGGSVCHGGWNSAIECLCAGLPVIAWPLHSDQFLNERLLVDVLKTGVRVLEGETRVEKLVGKKVVSGEKVREAVAKLLGEGEEVKEMRRKAKEYSKLAKMAMEEGGSSSLDLSSLFHELTAIAQKRR